MLLFDLLQWTDQLVDGGLDLFLTNFFPQIFIFSSKKVPTFLHSKYSMLHSKIII